MIALIENTCVEKKQWITHDEMMNITVVAESTPGPIAINCATYVGYKEKGFFEVFGLSFRKAALVMRMCWESIFDLITGRFGFEAVSGPVGISTTIGTAASIGIEPLLYLVALISINLGFMNMLPIPALDGGRTLTTLIEMITRKRIPPKVERIINGVGLAVLLTLSAVVLIKDVVWLIFK